MSAHQSKLMPEECGKALLSSIEKIHQKDVWERVVLGVLERELLPLSSVYARASHE